MNTDEQLRAMSMSGETTLIINVDDHDGARYVKTRILQNAGFQVEEAANGTDALALVLRHMPALVLLDVKLPDINGIEVCRRIKSDPATAGVLVLQTSAALTGRDDKIRGLEGGADNYLAAPIEADELVANVRALLRLRQTQNDLRNSEERFRQLTDNIEDVFWMFGLQHGELLYVSVAYDAMWGQSRAQLAQQPDSWIEAIHAPDRERVVAAWRALPQGGVYEQEYRIDCRDEAAGMRWVRDRAFLVRDVAQQPYRIARITNDISRRKEMESLLRVADENKNNFLATLAHELRNPLSPIRNAVALMDGADGSQAGVHERARQVITRQINHLTRLVDDLLDVARISEGKLTLQLQQVELHAVLVPAIETAAPALEARGHRLEVDTPEQTIWLSGDPVRLAQAIGNLLQNAGKFTSPNGLVRLSVSLAGDSHVRITVTDNGIGISHDNLPRIFDMFTQGAAAPDRVHDGLGIGLSLVSTLARLHGGSLEAESAGIGQGSSFTIELPVMQVPPGAAPVPMQAVAPAPAVATSAARKVLLVDDNVDSAEIMAELLSALGHDVQVAHDADGALALAEQQRPDVILLDIGLPKIDGYTLARMLRAKPEFATTRMIAHTGYGSPQDREKSRAAGFDFHLVKPANLDELQAAMGA